MNILFISATTIECDNERWIGDHPIHTIGVGKLSSSFHTQKLIHEYRPQLVINFGSCGTTKKDLDIGLPYEVRTVYQDIDTRPLGYYGTIPYSDTSDLVVSDSPYRLFTTDTFYDNSRTDYSIPYLESVQHHHFVDMEGYSIAYTCQQLNIPLRMFKWVSDDGDATQWKENAQLGYQNFVEIIRNDYL